MHRHACGLLGLAASGLLATAPARAQTAALASATRTLPGSARTMRAICAGEVPFPAIAPMPLVSAPPRDATAGTPRIEQVRAGRLIATYRSFSDGPGCDERGDGSQMANPRRAAGSGCGPFTRSHSYTMVRPGDVFKVYPAIYAGNDQQPYIGPSAASDADYAAHRVQIPTNITIQGVVQNGVQPVILLDAGASDNNLGQAPVYIAESRGVTWDHISVRGGPHASVGKAGFYNEAGSNLTTSNMRVSGFGPNAVQQGGANGLFGAGLYAGWWTISHVELDHNGGTNGPTHNAYIARSTTDPNYAVQADHIWSHDAFYGHLFKSRAQRNTITASYFQGGLPVAPQTQSETYLLDIPNGGILHVSDSIFEKGASGPDSNAMSIAFLMEGRADDRPQSVEIRNNTFVAEALTIDGSHPLYPLNFLYPALVPGSAAWPADIATRVVDNVFAGYCRLRDAVKDYRGDVAVLASPADLTATRGLVTPVLSDDAALARTDAGYTSNVGASSYVHALQGAPRGTAAIGAKD